MKHIIIILIVITTIMTFILCAPKPTPLAAPGGTYCTDVGADYSRVETAYGSILGLKDASGNPRPATPLEVETAVFDWLEGSTHDYERRQNMASYSPPPFGSAKKYHAATPTPTPKK